MIRRKLCNWFSKIAIGEHPAMPALAQRPASRPRRTFVGGCRCVALVLIVFTGMRKSCCGDCRLPDQASFSVSSLTFTPQVPNPAGPASAPQSVTLTATGEAGSSLSISSITASSDFSETNDCPASLATQSSCTIQVSFSPNSVGVIQGQLVLDGTSGVQLSGTGIAPVTFSPAIVNQREILLVILWAVILGAAGWIIGSASHLFSSAPKPDLFELHVAVQAMKLTEMRRLLAAEGATEVHIKDRKTSRLQAS